MEKLLYSSTPIKTSLINSSSSLPRLARVNSPKFLSFSSLNPNKTSTSTSCKTHNPLSPIPPRFQLPPLFARRVDSPTSLDESPNGVSSGQPKAISASTFFVISAVIALLVNPFLPQAAYASFQTVGGPTRLVRTELLNSIWTGFLAGCLHTLSGPDHLAALAPLSIGRTRVESAMVGALWGCGHDAGQVIFGLIFLLLKDRLQIEIIRTWGSRVVGFTLMIIGAMGIKEATEVPTPCVALENGECEIPTYEKTPPVTGKKKKVGFATFATGIVHGLQPDALMIILPALALPSRVAGAAFLGMFLLGTVVSMGSYTLFLSSCSQALRDKVPRITEKLTWAASLVAIGRDHGCFKGISASNLDKSHPIFFYQYGHRSSSESSGRFSRLRSVFLPHLRTEQSGLEQPLLPEEGRMTFLRS
ncbi:hypothetical protein ACFE04_015874 [Oxalis oulophora]